MSSIPTNAGRPASQLHIPTAQQYCSLQYYRKPCSSSFLAHSQAAVTLCTFTVSLRYDIQVFVYVESHKRPVRLYGSPERLRRICTNRVYAVFYVLYLILFSAKTSRPKPIHYTLSNSNNLYYQAKSTTKHVSISFN